MASLPHGRPRPAPAVLPYATAPLLHPPSLIPCVPPPPASTPPRAYILGRLLWTVALPPATAGPGYPHTPIYDAVAPALRVFQTGAVAEVAHAATGLVRTPAATTALQVGSRLFLLWPILEGLPPVRGRAAVATMVGAWAATEVPRYAFYAVGAAAGGAAVPRWLVWLRYTTFLPLYPLGAGSEVALILAALPVLARARGAYLSVAMPNAWNVVFDFWTWCVFIVVMYVPGLPFMYMHMMRQRRKALGGGQKAKAA